MASSPNDALLIERLVAEKLAANEKAMAGLRSELALAATMTALREKLDAVDGKSRP